MKCNLEKSFSGDKLKKAQELKRLYNEREEAPRMSTKKRSKAQEDLLKDAYLNPLKYAEEVMARSNTALSAWIDILGGTVFDLVSPHVKKGHAKLAKSNDYYRHTINLIRTGFVESRFAQEMLRTLDLARDVDEKTFQDLLQIGESIEQESRTYLEQHLPELEKKLDAMYPDEEDQIRLYQIFAKTGIANLSIVSEVATGVINENMSLEAAQAFVESQVTIDEEINSKLEDIVDGYLNGVNESGYTNPRAAGLVDKRYKTIVALRALQRIDGAEKMLQEMDLETKQDLYNRTTAILQMSDIINERQTDEYGKRMDPENGQYRADYDGHMMKDLYDTIYEHVLVTEEDLKHGKYLKEDGWKVIVKPSSKDSTIGIVARSKEDASSVPGVGLNKDRFNNGFYLDVEDSKRISNMLEAMKEVEDRKEYLRKNNLVRSGSRYRVILSEKDKVDKLGMKQSLAHTLMRTFVHNKELIETQSVRDIVMNKATKKIRNETELRELNRQLAKNHYRKAEDKEVMPMFLNLTMDYDSYDDLPVWIKRQYVPAKGVSAINGFNKQISLVKVSMESELMGHPNFSIFGKNAPRNLVKIEKYYKEMVIMAKQKMVILDPPKLMMDAVSNVGILAMKDVNIIDMKRGFSEGMKYYKEFSELRTQLVDAKLRLKLGEPIAKERIKLLEHKIEKHPFYDSWKAGFIQSYSTSLVVKEFDTLTGLQADIDKLVESITKDKKGNPNIIFKAIKTWQKLGAERGMTVDALFKSASELSRVNGTAIGTEMENIAKRLESNRKDPDSVARYMNEVIGGPSSEAIRWGGAAMVTMDALSKYTLAKALIGKRNPKTKRKYTKEEAYIEANNTFIDYRRNLPKEIKTLSDYGVLMFPSFWIKAQKIILGLLHYHPSTAISSYVIADVLDVSGASIIDVNLVNKIHDGTVINEPTSLVDWEVLSPWLKMF